jgi:hypothetical protein
MKKFQQFVHTDFYTYPYNKLFGYQGLTNFSQKVLDGTVTPPPKASNYIIDFLSHLQMPQKIRDNPTKMELTLESFISFWRKLRNLHPSTLVSSLLPL